MTSLANLGGAKDVPTGLDRKGPRRGDYYVHDPMRCLILTDVLGSCVCNM